MKLCSGSSALLSSALLLSGLASAKDIKVKPGQTIQSVIDGASPGDRITVPKGTYAEQLTITKNGIQLIGQNGAILVPGTSVVNGCTGLVGAGLNAGICVYGPGVQLTDDVVNDEHRKVVNSITTYVENVVIKGFEIHGFDGLNIAIVGAKNTVVRENTLWNGVRYGALTVGSKGTTITRNTVKADDLFFIGICMDDKSDVSVTQNVVSDYKIGLCVQTNGADVGHNQVSNCCVGAFVDPLVEKASLTHNKISGLIDPARCAAEFFITGIALQGTINANLQHNDITGVTDGGHPTGLGIVPAIGIFDDFEGHVATGSTIDFNNLTNNAANIFLGFTSGKHEVKHNTCFNPSNFCNL
jgi:hypothetical protein